MLRKYITNCIKKFNHGIEHKKTTFFITAAILIVLIITIFSILMNNDSTTWKGWNDLGICFVGVVGAFASLVGARRAHIEPSPFHQNSVKRWYHTQNRPDKYLKICLIGFYCSVIIAIVCTIVFVIKRFFI